MIDLHCHILPDIDDGPATMREAVEMCRVASADGIETIVATPHFKPGSVVPNRVAERITELRDALAASRVGLEVLPGADIAVTPELPAHLSDDRSLFLNGGGKYFLAELPHETVPARWDQFLLSLKSRGITPILTHPERHRWFLGHPDALIAYVLGGGLVQITAMSVTGGFGQDVREHCLSLLRRNLVHVIATDAHSVDLRPPVLSAARRAAADVVGERDANRLVRDIPLAVIRGEQIEVPAPVMNVPRKRRWYHRVLDL